MKETEMLAQLVKFQVKVAALRSERGATAVEYGLMVALIAGAIIVIVGTLGGQLNAVFTNVSSKLATAV
jgi:pilus assembly protein Flp/PilA